MNGTRFGFAVRMFVYRDWRFLEVLEGSRNALDGFERVLEAPTMGIN
jgi:hypothetical protein